MAREVVSAIVSLFWIVSVGCGFWVFDRYGSTPGAIGCATPDSSEGQCGSWQLTLFAHPHCPCVRASFAVLDELARSHPSLVVRVAFVRPPGASAGWERSETLGVASAIPGARVYCDAAGAEAKCAGAETSGFVILTDPTGRVAFRGGLTPRRGHGRAGPGRRAVCEWLTVGCGPASAPTFGCPLFDTTD